MFVEKWLIYILVFYTCFLCTESTYMLLVFLYFRPTGHLTEYLESMEKIDQAVLFFQKNNPDSIELSVLVFFYSFNYILKVTYFFICWISWKYGDNWYLMLNYF